MRSRSRWKAVRSGSGAPGRSRPFVASANRARVDERQALDLLASLAGGPGGAHDPMVAASRDRPEGSLDRSTRGGRKEGHDANEDDHPGSGARGGGRGVRERFRIRERGPLWGAAGHVGRLLDRAGQHERGQRRIQLRVGRIRDGRRLRHRIEHRHGRRVHRRGRAHGDPGQLLVLALHREGEVRAPRSRSSTAPRVRRTRSRCRARAST